MWPRSRGKNVAEVRGSLVAKCQTCSLAPDSATVAEGRCGRPEAPDVVGRTEALEHPTWARLRTEPRGTRRAAEPCGPHLPILWGVSVQVHGATCQGHPVQGGAEYTEAEMR